MRSAAPERMPSTNALVNTDGSGLTAVGQLVAL
jgi:hypothetical protein